MKWKCPVCNSCMKRIWNNNHMVFYCDFCRKHFKQVNDKWEEIKQILY